MEYEIYNKMFIVKGDPRQEIDIKEFKKEFRKSKAWLGKYITNFDCKEETNWWFCIKDKKINLDEFTSKYRSQIKKGLKNCNVQLINENFLNEMYEVYISASKKYTVVKLDNNYKLFKEITLNAFNNENIKVFGVFNSDNKMIAYGYCQEGNGFVNCLVYKLDLNFLKLRGSDAIIYYMVNYYFNNEGEIFSDGERSVRHTSKVQDYLYKTFKFRKAYCEMHLVYKKWFWLFLNVCKPFKKIIIKLAKNSEFFNKVLAILKMEEFKYKG